MSGWIQGIKAYSAAMDVMGLLRSNSTTRTAEVNDTAAAVGGDALFSDIVRGVFSKTANIVRGSESLAQKSLVKQAPLQDVVVSVSEAETALRTVVALRDRVISAYQEIMRMPI